MKTVKHVLATTRKSTRSATTDEDSWKMSPPPTASFLRGHGQLESVCQSLGIEVAFQFGVAGPRPLRTRVRPVGVRPIQRNSPSLHLPGKRPQDERGGRFECETRLARASRPGEREETRASVEQRKDFRELFGTPDEGARRPRQVRVRDRL